MKTLIFALLAAPILALAQANQARSDIVFDHVTVIDATGAPAQSDMRVTVRGGRIAAIEAASASRPSGAIDGRGKFLIPGLWDFHVHTGQRDVYLPLYLANGVTGVRDMGGDLAEPTGYSSIRYIELAQWREAIARGSLAGPQMVLAGFLIDGEAWPGNIAVQDAEQGRAAVAALQRVGVDFIKVKSALTRASYLAIADEARLRHMDVAGHVPASVGAVDAAMAGQKSIEHLDGIALASSAHAAALAQELTQAYAERNRERYARAEASIVASYDAPTAMALFSTLALQHTWQVPTLVELRRNLLGFTPDPILWRYVPASMRRRWQQESGSHADATAQRQFERLLSLVGAMHAAGVQFIAGTDSANPSLVPGFSLHDELVLINAAGLTPMQALQAATRNPASYLGREGQTGTIEIGARADLLLLDADPLANIANTRRIQAVMANGRLFTRADLDALLSTAAAAAEKL